MDPMSAGEDFYATMKRSTNGGGENSLFWKVKTIFMSCFLPDYKIENGGKKIEEQQKFYL